MFNFFATDAVNNIFSEDLDEIDEENTKVDTPTGNLAKTTMQQLIVGSVTGGDVTQGTLTITAKFIYRDWETDRKSTRLNSSHSGESRMPSSA